MLATTNFKRKDKNEAFNTASNLLQDIDKELNPLFIEVYLDTAVKVLSFYVAKDNNQHFENTMKGLNALYKDFPELQKYIFSKMSILCYQLQQQCHLAEEFDKRKTDELAKFLDTDVESLPQGGYLCFNLGRYYFFYGKLELAKSYLLKTLSLPKQYRIFYDGYCRFLYLMIEIQLEHYNMADRAIKELRRHLKKNEDLIPFHKKLIDFFKMVCENWHQSKFPWFLEKLEEIMPENDFEINFLFRRLEISTWLKANQKKMNNSGL